MRKHLARSLLDVFVSIEMTGQGVSFEQKFNYRHTMYQTLHLMHTIPTHREALSAVCTEAIINIESAQQPLFLRFINLLMNDSNYLLDEILKHMQELKQKELERAHPEHPEHPEQQGLPPGAQQGVQAGLLPGAQPGVQQGVAGVQQAQRAAQEQEQEFRHVGMLARLYNQLGSETLGALEELTEGLFI